MDKSSSESRWIQASNVVRPPVGVRPGRADTRVNVAFDACGVQVNVCEVIAWPEGFGFSIEFLLDESVRTELRDIESLSAGLDFYRRSAAQPDGRCRVELQTCAANGGLVDGPALAYNGGGTNVGRARTDWIGCALPGDDETQLIWVKWPDVGVPAFAVSLAGSILHAAPATSASH